MKRMICKQIWDLEEMNEDMVDIGTLTHKTLSGDTLDTTVKTKRITTLDIVSSFGCYNSTTAKRQYFEISVVDGKSLILLHLIMS